MAGVKVGGPDPAPHHPEYLAYKMEQTSEPFEEYLLHIEGTERPLPAAIATATAPAPLPLPLPFANPRPPLATPPFSPLSAYLSWLKHAKLILQVLCRRRRAAAFIFCFVLFSFYIFCPFPVFHIWLFLWLKLQMHWGKMCALVIQKYFKGLHSIGFLVFTQKANLLIYPSRF